jgi:hypothetical protein
MSDFPADLNHGRNRLRCQYLLENMTAAATPIYPNRGATDGQELIKFSMVYFLFFIVFPRRKVVHAKFTEREMTRRKRRA